MRSVGKFRRVGDIIRYLVYNYAITRSRAAGNSYVVRGKKSVIHYMVELFPILLIRKMHCFKFVFVLAELGIVYIIKKSIDFGSEIFAL